MQAHRTLPLWELCPCVYSGASITRCHHAQIELGVTGDNFGNLLRTARALLYDVQGDIWTLQGEVSQRVDQVDAVHLGGHAV